MSEPAPPRASDPVQPASGEIGVLLVNLGTPDEPSPRAVRRYLAEFLSDPRVVEIPALVWQPILRGLVLTTRAPRSARAYQQVWTDAGSPLAAITAAQAAALRARLAGEARVGWAMRYGSPALAPEIAGLQDAGCDRILVAPLYPQYSAATTASVLDALGAALARMRWNPAIRTLPPYFADPAYIAALAADLGEQIDALGFAPEVLLLSFHSMPARTVALGDPYRAQCEETARLLAAALRERRPGLRIATSFQSRFGRAKWLEPYTDATLAAEAAAGTRRLAVAAPGFSADCLETLEELGIAGREQFLAAGGAEFAALACLNARPAGMAMLEALVRRELAGWLPAR